MDHHESNTSEGVIVEEKSTVSKKIRGDLEDQGGIGRHEQLAEQEEKHRQGCIKDRKLDPVGGKGTELCRRGAENGIVAAKEQIFKRDRLAWQKKQSKDRGHGKHEPGVLSVDAD